MEKEGLLALPDQPFWRCAIKFAQCLLYSINGDRFSLVRLVLRGNVVGATGFEPATSWSQTKCSSQAELRSDTRASKYPTTAGLRNNEMDLPLCWTPGGLC